MGKLLELYDELRWKDSVLCQSPEANMRFVEQDWIVKLEQRLKRLTDENPEIFLEDACSNIDYAIVCLDKAWDYAILDHSQELAQDKIADFRNALNEVDRQYLVDHNL